MTTTTATSAFSEPLTAVYPTSLFTYQKYSGPCLVHANISAVIFGSPNNTTISYSQAGIDICTAGSPLFDSPAQDDSAPFLCGFSGGTLDGTTAMHTVQCAATALNASFTGSGSVYTLYNPTTSYTLTTTSTEVQFPGAADALPTRFVPVPTGTDLSGLIIPTSGTVKSVNISRLLGVVLGAALVFFLA